MALPGKSAYVCGGGGGGGGGEAHPKINIVGGHLLVGGESSQKNKHCWGSIIGRG